MELLFHRVYEMSDLMAIMVNVSGSFEELDWESADVSGCLNRFTKTSILAHFCFTHIRMHDLKTARKDPEIFEVDDLEAALKSYAIPFTSFNDFIRRDFPED